MTLLYLTFTRIRLFFLPIGAAWRKNELRSSREIILGSTKTSIGNKHVSVSLCRFLYHKSQNDCSSSRLYLTDQCPLLRINLPLYYKDQLLSKTDPVHCEIHTRTLSTLGRQRVEFPDNNRWYNTASVRVYIIRIYILSSYEWPLSLVRLGVNQSFFVFLAL